jgi:hypothetical protein
LVEASDPDLDELSFAWQSPAGEFRGGGPVVAWHAPLFSGTYQVSVTVSDGRPGGDVERAAGVEVVDAPPPGGAGGENRAPVVVRVTADPASVGPSETSRLAAEAFDQDGDTLGYRWEANSGEITASGATATYRAPGALCCPMTAVVKVAVEDGRGGLALGSASVEVRP